MKKTKSLLGLAVLVLSAGALVACGGEPAEESKAPATSTCKHKWVDDAVVKEATCSEEGVKTQKCSVCGEKKENVKISKKAHTYVADAEHTTAATCTTAGVDAQKCSVCGNATTTEVEALGHNWGDAVWATQPTCEAAGAGERECGRCHTKEAVTQEALGHDIQLVGDETEPEAGKAKVRVYSCTHEGCNKTDLGFKANEASAGSLEHLVVAADGGTKFWGRPIGNAMELNDSGDASGADAEKVYDASVSGDYFEYVFDLTAAQLASLGSTQYLYAQAKAANYLTGMDFWAAGSGEEWTPGYYVETTADHEAGTPIADYRYILYVDDQPVNFDATMTAPVTGAQTNQPQKEYRMPYTFRLHTGTNKIKLVMAGGYKSTFYNFIFRPAA